MNATNARIKLMRSSHLRKPYQSRILDQIVGDGNAIN